RNSATPQHRILKPLKLQPDFSCCGVAMLPKEKAMSNDLAKTPKGPAPAAPMQDAASRLKHGLMADALERMLGKEAEKPIALGTPRVLLALANHSRSPGWDRAKVLQGQMFEAASRSGLEMKFAFYAEDDDKGMRRCRITKRWIANSDDMASIMDR